MSIKAVRSMGGIPGASKEQPFESERPQILHDAGQEYFANSEILIVRQQRKHLDLTRIPNSKAVADDRAAFRTYVAHDLTRLDTLG